MTSLWLPVLIVAGNLPRFAPAAHRPVMTWVPPYAVAASVKQLENPALQGAITDLCLQFWAPTKAGTAIPTSSPEVTPEAVAKLRDWAHAHAARAMLCVFNGAPDWDWPLARAAFSDHRDKFIESLIAEMDRFKLDGVDIDLEGPAQYEPDKPAFVSFIAELSRRLHARHKRLTVDSFCYIWNAPNQGWWSDLFPLVDSITSMGYENTGLSAPDWAAYAAQVKAAGVYAPKLQIGVPSDKESWAGNSAQEQLDWILKDGQSGLGIWDAQFSSAAWKTTELWRTIEAIRSGPSGR